MEVHQANIGNRRASKSTVIATALVVLAAANLSAEPIVFSNRLAFEAALGAHITDDYSAPAYRHGDIHDSADLDQHSDRHMSAVLGETRYITTGQPGTNLIVGQGSIFLGERDNPKYCAGCTGSFRLLFDATSGGPREGVLGAGFDYFSFRDEFSSDEVFLYDAFVEFADGSFRSFDLAAAESSLGFFGVTSASRIRSIHFAPQGGRDPSMTGAFGIDDLTIGGTATPEPGTMTLLGAALLAIGHRAWRGRRCVVVEE